MPSLFTTRNLHPTVLGTPVGIIIGVIISKLVIVPGPA